MATIDVGDVLEVVQTWDTPLASVAQNVWHLKMISGAGAESAAILAAIETQQQVAMAAVEDELSDQFEVTLLELRKWDFALHRFDGVGSLAATGIVGASIVDYSPHGVAGKGRILTENARRQGGTFIPGIVDTSIIAGVLVAAAESALTLYLQLHDTDISVTGGLLTWCTFNTEPLSPLFETASLAIQVVVANSLPSYLTKRKPGVGL